MAVFENPQYPGYKVVSVSQLNTFERCNRLWWFEKVAGVRQAAKGYFVFGSALHKCIEKYLNGEDPFPKNWWQEEGLDLDQANDIATLVSNGIQEKVIPDPESLEGKEFELEHEFFFPLGSGLPHITGFIDFVNWSDGEVTDWKTTSAWRYAKSKNKLAVDRQMLTYGAVASRFESEKVKLTHGVFLKHTHRNARDRAKARSRKRSVEVDRSDLMRNWSEMRALAASMMEVAEAKEWSDVPDPVNMPEPCNDFGGCHCKDICFKKITLESHLRKITRAEEPIMGLAERLAAARKGQISKEQPVQEQPVQEQPVQEQPVQEQPVQEQPVQEQPVQEQPVQEQPVQEAETSPWAKPNCPACKGTGYATKPENRREPCRICDAMGSPKSVDYHLEYAEGNPFPEITPKTHLEKDPINGPVPTGIKPAKSRGLKVVQDPPASTGAQEASGAVQEPPKRRGRPPGSKNKANAATSQNAAESATEKQKQRLKALEQKKAAEAQSKQKELSYIVCIDTHIQGVPPYPVVSLQDLLFQGEWGKQIAKECEATNYLNSDPFRRRDAVIALAPALAKTLEGKVLLVNTGNVEEAQTYTAFIRPEALVIRRN